MTDIDQNGEDYNSLNRYKTADLIRFVLILLIVFLLGAMTALFFSPYLTNHLTWIRR